LNAENASEGSTYWIFSKDPNVQAFTDLLNRAIDKPSEQVQVTGDGSRPHSSVGPGTPDRSSLKAELQPQRHCLPKDCRVVAKSVLGGLHHEYSLEKVAA